MVITKGQLMDILNSIEADPQLLSKIVVDTMKRLPDSYRWQLAQQLYMEYYWDGPIITVTNNLTHVSRKFGSTTDIVLYLKGLGYKASAQGVRNALAGHKDYCNHSFETQEEKEITFVE